MDRKGAKRINNQEKKYIIPDYVAALEGQKRALDQKVMIEMGGLAGLGSLNKDTQDFSKWFNNYRFGFFPRSWIKPFVKAAFLAGRNK